MFRRGRGTGPIRGPRTRRGAWPAVAAVVLMALVVNLVPAVRHGVIGRLSDAVTAAVGVVRPHDAEVDRLTRARLAAEQRADAVTDAESVVRQARELSGSGVAAGHHLTTARVIAFTPVGAAGNDRRVRLDRGRADGLRVDQAVVAPGGLVGRVTSVSAHSSTVTLVSDPASVVGARLQRSHALGRVTGAPPSGFGSRGNGAVTLVVAPGGSVQVGDTVVTAGSPGGHPYPPGIPLGRVTRLDPDHGQAERSATVRPGVDLAALDLVGVLTDTGQG